MIKLLDQTALCQASEVHLRSSRCLLTVNGQNADPDLISDPALTTRDHKILYEF